MLQELTAHANRLSPTQEEFHRLEYSLKLNLRLMNARLKDLRIYRINQSSNTHDRGLAFIETMEMVTASNIAEIDQLTSNRFGKLNISCVEPKMFTYGTVIEDADELSMDTEFAFCVYRVGIGRAYCHKLGQDERWQDLEEKPGYDSIFLESRGETLKAL